VKKHTFPLIALALAALFPAACRKSPERPNIVLIIVDALRADHLPFYGYAKDTAPFLTGLSVQGSVFVHAYSSSNWTDPATGSIFTSLYPFQHRGLATDPAAADGGETEKPFLVSAIADSVTTIAEVLNSAGYRTFGISTNFFVSPQRGYDQGFDFFQNFPMKTGADIIHAKLTEWEGEMRRGPYFLFLHYTDIHIPYTRRAPWYKPGKDRTEDFISAYDSNIPYLDAKIRALYDRMGWDRDTILIITADHGEEFWEKGYRGHGHNLFNGSLRVPLLICLPKGQGWGRRIEPNVSTIDILPTLSDYLGLEADPQLEGVSLLPVMRGKPGALTGRPIYAYVERGRFRFRCILRDNWKLIMTPEGDRYFLFDLAGDPDEKKNLANDGRETERKLEMARQYWEFEKNSRKYEQKMVPMEYTRKQLEELKALGYIK
jgi:arylsulfatase A-like enzyme